MLKLISRKLLVIMLNIALIALNKKYGLGLDGTDIIGIAGASSAYLLGQSYVDAKRSE